IDQIPVFLTFGRRRTHAEQAVFRVQHHFTVFGQVIGYQRRQPDAEVHIGALGAILGDTRRDLVTSIFIHGPPQALAGTLDPTCTMRCTKIPRVTTFAGYNSTSSTTSLT